MIVLDFTWGMAGSMATMVLSDFGADVIKIEPPGGDPFRAFPPSLLWNRGKKSIILDLKSAEGQREAQRLAQRSDIVVESFRPGVTGRLGIDYETLRADHPELVYCSITGFGPQGAYARYKGYEGVVAAKCGRMMAFAGQKLREGPVFPVVNTASHAAAMAAVRGIVAALYMRDMTGQGQKVETSLLQAITLYDLGQWILWQMMIKDPENFPSDVLVDPMRQPGLGYLPARTKDGRWIQLGNLMEHLFRASLQAIGLGEVLDNPRFAEAPLLLDQEREELRDMMLKAVQQKSLDEWMDLFVHEIKDVAAEPFMTSQEGMNHPQILFNRHVEEVIDPGVGKMRQLGTLLFMKETPASIKGPAPSPDQHHREVFNRLQRLPAKGGSSQNTALPKYPLEGITILDFSTVIAGPLGTSLVAELGARVIRIETLEGDWMRRQNNGIAAHRTMAGTEGISVDLKTPEGLAIIHALVVKVDIVVHNMRPGVVERLGIGYEQLRQINPRLIFLYVAGYGSTGPYSHRPALHPIGGAIAGGALAQMGQDSLPPPDTPLSLEELREVSRQLGRANEVNPDPNTAMVVSTGLMLGLYARQRFGVAQYLETTMIGANAYANADDFFSYEGKPPRAIPDAEGYGLNALYRLYRAGKGWVFLACPFDHEWRSLCRTMGRQDLLEDSRFVTAKARQQHDASLIHELEKVFATRPAQAWEELLTAADIACVQVEDSGMFHFFSEDRHVKENAFTTEIESL
ncbi:MAG: CoA transferase, partial [Dehalococcoidia bacterium]